MSTNIKLWKLFIVLVVFPLSTDVFANSNEISYVAKWKGNAQAAYSITIDDNGEGDMRNIQASILEEYGVRGTFNIITDFLARKPAKRQMFLDIFNRGHELASHSATHPFLKGADIDLIWSELSESKRFIEELTGEPCVSYTAPYGDMDPNISEVAQEFYISARGTRSGINAIADANIYNLKIGPPPPYYIYDPNTAWTDEEYCERLKTYVKEVIAAGGWGIDMFHNLGLFPSEKLNSGSQINESVLRNHLSDITSSYASSLWVAPQGKVARYHLEWQETTINSYAITDHVILVDLLFDGDRRIFNEPLTILTTIPEHWLNGSLTVMQQGSLLDYIVEQDQTESRLVYDAVPGAGAISIVFENTENVTVDLDGDGDVDIDDLVIFLEDWIDAKQK